MSGTYTVQVGNKGRLVMPAEIRERRSWHEGTTLIAVETWSGVVLISREDARHLIAEQVAGHDLVGELLKQRRADQRGDDTA